MVPALLLALLVPARGLALCCLEREGRVSAHESSHHDSARPADGAHAGHVTLAAMDDCAPPPPQAPALRERGRDDSIPGAVPSFPPPSPTTSSGSTPPATVQQAAPRAWRETPPTPLRL